MIGSIISLIGNAAAGLISSHAQRRQQQKAEQLLNQEQTRLKDAYLSSMGTSYLDRADARQNMRKALQASTDAIRGLNTQAVKSGMTDEAKIAMASNQQKNIADIAGQMAVAGEQYKDQQRENYENANRQLLSQRLGLLNTDFSPMAQAIAEGASAVGNLVDEGLSGAVKKKPAQSNVIAKSDPNMNAWRSRMQSAFAYDPSKLKK